MRRAYTIRHTHAHFTLTHANRLCFLSFFRVSVYIFDAFRFDSIRGRRPSIEHVHSVYFEKKEKRIRLWFERQAAVKWPCYVYKDWNIHNFCFSMISFIGAHSALTRRRNKKNKKLNQQQRGGKQTKTNSCRNYFPIIAVDGNPIDNYSDFLLLTSTNKKI